MMLGTLSCNKSCFTLLLHFHHVHGILAINLYSSPHSTPQLYSSPLPGSTIGPSLFFFLPLYIYIYIYISLSLSLSESRLQLQSTRETKNKPQKRIKQENPRHLFLISESSAHPSTSVGKISHLLQSFPIFSRLFHSYGLHVSRSLSESRLSRFRDLIGGMHPWK